MNRKKHLKKALNDLNCASQELYETTSPLSEEEIGTRPALDSWSVGEIMHHIILSEEASAAALRDALNSPNPTLTDNIVSETLRPLVLLATRHGGMAMKMKSPPMLEPVKGFPHLYLVRKLAQVREQTFDLAERLHDQLKPVYIKEERTGIVFSGEDWLELIANHQCRHISQICKAIESLEAQKKKLAKPDSAHKNGSAKKGILKAALN